MHIVQGRALRAIVASIGVAALLAAGCGSPARPAGDRGRPVPSPSTVPAPTPSQERASATPSGGYGDPLDRYAYREAFGRCATLGVAAVVDAYGAPASDAVSAASAYADHSYPRTARYRQAATQGCLDGFSSRGT